MSDPLADVTVEMDAPPRGVWLPIETAPSELLVRVMLFDGRIIVGIRGENGEWQSDGGLLIRASHWRPLPEPPK